MKDLSIVIIQQTQEGFVDLEASLGVAKSYLSTLSQAYIKTSQEITTTKLELHKVQQIERDRWTIREAELTKKMAAKSGTYFQRGFEGVVKQFKE